WQSRTSVGCAIAFGCTVVSTTDLTRQPHQRMSKIDDVLERRSQQILLTIVSRLGHRAPNADDPPRNRTKRRKAEAQFAKKPAPNPRFLAKTVISDSQLR